MVSRSDSRKLFALGALLFGLIASGCSSEEEACSSPADCLDGETCFRSQCIAACIDRSDCQDGEGCREGVCLPGDFSECSAAADCVQPDGPCSVAEGAACADGVCVYRERACDSPPADRCSDDQTILVRSQAPGSCNESTGACEYPEEEIAVDPANCEVIASEGCEAVTCPDTDCAVNGVANLDSPSCACDYAELFGDSQPCNNDEFLCSIRSTCDGEGECVIRDSIRAGERCSFDGVDVDALDDDGRPRQLDPEESRELVPIPFCDSDGRCIECRADTAAEDCDDGNACTEDVCENGLCKNFAEPQENAECVVEEDDPLFGDAGFCAEGSCLQCDSSISDVELRDQACERLDENGNVNVCLPGVCEDDSCEYDTGADPARGLECRRAGNEPGFCLAGGCVECLENSQCPDDDNPCTDAVCESNTCTQRNNDLNVCVDGETDQFPDLCVDGVCVPCTVGDTRRDGSEILEPSECNRWDAIGGRGDGEPRCAEVAIDNIQGNSCNDGRLCTVQAVCEGGSSTSAAACVRQTAVSCNGQCESTCNESTGACTIAQGRSCNDGDDCTYGETCQSNGQCVSGNPRLTCGDLEDTPCGTVRRRCNNTSSCLIIDSPEGDSCSADGCNGTCDANGNCDTDCGGGGDDCPPLPQCRGGCPCPPGNFCSGSGICEPENL